MEFDGFDWDDGNWTKCGKHGVTKTEIEAVLSNPGTPIFPDAAHGLAEVREIAVGISPETGHAMAIFFTRRIVSGRLLLPPVSARYMHEKEVRRYEQTSRR
jgi:uncharacterized DUF497 family protein